MQSDFRTDHMARLQGVKKEEGETESICHKNIFKTSPLLNTESNLYAATGNVNCSGNKFDFGTSAEDASGPKVLFKTHQNPIYVQSNIQGGGGKGVDGGLAHPKLFGDQAKREKRYSTTESLFKPTLGKHLNSLEFCRFLERVFALRQAVLAGKSK